VRDVQGDGTGAVPRAKTGLALAFKYVFDIIQPTIPEPEPETANPPSLRRAGHQPEEKAPPSRAELLLFFPAHPGFVQATPF